MKQISLKIGPYSLHAVPTGQFGLDGGAMFGTVPKVLWQKNHPADEYNRIQMEARALLLKSDTQNILIDCGNGSDFIEKYGEKLGSKFNEMYNIDQSKAGLLKSLEEMGVSAEQITDVILTHLHFDHAGGATRSLNNTLVPTFPNAQYYLQRTNLETARKPNLRERASYFQANYQPLLDQKKLVLLEGTVEHLFPHISVHVSNGHTTGQQVVLISDEKTSLLYCADLIPTSSHVRLAWVMGYDLRPADLIEEKKYFLEKASKENWYLFFEHDADCDIAQVQALGQDFVLSEKYKILSP